MGTRGPDPADCTIRVVNIYATPWRFTDSLSDDEGTPSDLSGLEEHYTLYKEQLPQLLPDRVLGDHLRSGIVTLAEGVDGVTVENTKAELFMLPSKQVVLAVTMCLHGGVLLDEERAKPIVEVLERCIVEDVRDIQIAGCLAAEPLNLDLVGTPARRFFSRDARGASLLPERHQLVFVARGEPVPNQQVIADILYRSVPPYRPEFIHPRWPKQLNNSVEDEQGGPLTPTTTLGVVTPYVSLLYGHEKYVEASIFLSTVHAVGTAAQFRRIWREAYHQVLQFREDKQKASAGEQTRDDLEELADNLGNLEFDLTFSVEFPLMRIETFQSDLYEAMDLNNQANTLSRMFDQLGGSLKSEITAIEVREQRRTNIRRAWNSVAASLLSLIGVPVGFVIAFLGINTTEVPEAPYRSMWDPHYASVYLVASIFALTPVLLIAVPYLWELPLRLGNRRASRSGAIVTILGAAIFISALILDLHQNTFARILDSIATACGAFFILVGLIPFGPAVWQRVRKLLLHQNHGDDAKHTPGSSSASDREAINSVAR